MKAKKLTIYDATKEELIQYFFQPDGFGGGYRIPAVKDRFLIWLTEKRHKELFDAYDQEAENSETALKLYISLIKQANDEKDFDKRIELLQKADKAYKQYERAERSVDRADKQLESLEW